MLSDIDLPNRGYLLLLSHLQQYLFNINYIINIINFANIIWISVTMYIYWNDLIHFNGIN